MEIYIKNNFIYSSFKKLEKKNKEINEFEKNTYIGIFPINGGGEYFENNFKYVKKKKKINNKINNIVNIFYNECHPFIIYIPDKYIGEKAIIEIKTKSFLSNRLIIDLYDKLVISNIIIADSIYQRVC